MRVSVIIPTLNRAPLLQDCLESFAKQISLPDEVVVVDNGSSDETRKIVKSFQDKLPLVYLFEPKRGASFARNLGIKKAKGEILGFLDDDRLADKNWVKKAREVGKEKNLVFTGKTEHIFTRENIFSQVFFLRQKMVWRQIKKPSPKKINDWQIVSALDSGNFCLRKEIFSYLKYPFDNKLFPFIGEQQELAERLQLAGFKIVYNPGLLTIHQKGTRTLKESMADNLFWGRAMGILQKKYQAPTEIIKLFGNQKRSDSQWQVLSLAWKLSSLPVFSLFLLEEMFFSLGKVWGRFLFREER